MFTIKHNFQENEVDKRGGGRSFYGGPRPFYGGSGFPYAYEKKAVEYYVDDLLKRGGARAMLRQDPEDSKEKRMIDEMSRQPFPSPHESTFQILQLTSIVNRG